MTSLPPPAAARSPSHRVIIIAALVAILTLVTVFGAGWYLSREQRAQLMSSNIPPYHIPSGSWTSGASTQWTATIPAEAEVFYAAGRLIAVQKENRTETATLTAYTVSDTGLSEAWTQTLELAKEPTTPVFPLWGEKTLIHNSKLIDVTTGELSPVPWKEGRSPIIAQDTAIVCDDLHHCEAWKEGGDAPIWHVELEEDPHWANHGDPDTEVYVRGDDRYAILGRHQPINLNTGELINLELPQADGYFVVSVTDGWLVHSSSTENPDALPYVAVYDITGGKETDSFSNNTWDGQGSMRGLVNPAALPASSYRMLWERSDPTILQAMYAVEGSCVVHIEVTEGATIDISAPSALSPNATSATDCVGNLVMSADKSVLIGQPNERWGVNSFTVMYNATTGQPINFQGVDPATGGAFELIGDNRVLGYDPASGTVASYTAGGSAS